MFDLINTTTGEVVLTDTKAGATESAKRMNKMVRGRVWIVRERKA